MMYGMFPVLIGLAVGKAEGLRREKNISGNLSGYFGNSLIGRRYVGESVRFATGISIQNPGAESQNPQKTNFFAYTLLKSIDFLPYR
jgi:hypothetical protein